MKKQNFINLNKLEFIITDACTGRCKHCSQGHHKQSAKCIDPNVASEAIKMISSLYSIKTVMTFGGEPLLFPESVSKIICTAKDLNIPHRQVITNGYFTNDKDKIKDVTEKLAYCGVNDLLLSVDAFHQEFIPLDVVIYFALESKKNGIPIRLQPAWLVAQTDENPYNTKTKSILESFEKYDIPIGNGNIIFPEGNALIYLAEYFAENVPINPYIENPLDIKCISFSANGDVLDGNIYKDNITQIIERYK